MNGPMKYIIGMLLAGLLLLPISIGAEEKKAEPTKTEPKKAEPSKEFGDFGWLTRGQKYGPWWILNSKWYDPLPDPVLYHLETSVSYTDTSGNVDGEYWNVNSSLVLRKNIVTSDTIYRYSKTDSKTFAGRSLTESENLTQMLTVDIYKWLAVEGGYLFYNDTTKFFDDSYSVFGGLGFWPLTKKNVNAKIGLYYGYGEIEYRNQDLALVGIEMPSYHSDGIFLNQKLYWKITDRLTFNQYLDYLYTFDDSDPPLLFGAETDAITNVIRLTFTATLSYSITPYFSIYSQYKLKHDDNPLAADPSPFLKYEKDDTSISFGFTIKL